MRDSAADRISHSLPGLDDGVVNAAAEALASAQFSAAELGHVAEEALAFFSGRRHARLVASGFAALQAALAVVGVRAGDSVLVPTVCCPSVYHAIRSLGANPLLVDVGERQPLLDTRLLRGSAARFVLVPQMFGLGADIGPLKKQGYRVIEDCAQCQRPLPDSLADVSIYSFSPTKLQTMGYGGGVVTDDPELAARLRDFLSPDEPRQWDDTLPFRVHAPVADFQSAMLSAQLRRYPEAVATRRHWVERYDQLLGQPERLLPEVPFRYQLILPPQRDARQVAEQLQAGGVMAWPLGSTLLNQVFGISGDYPNAEYWQRRLLSLPLHEGLNEEQVKRVCECYLELVG